jgi:hypothetical protein
MLSPEKKLKESKSIQRKEVQEEREVNMSNNEGKFKKTLGQNKRRTIQEESQKSSKQSI